MITNVLASAVFIQNTAHVYFPHHPVPALDDHSFIVVVELTCLLEMRKKGGVHFEPLFS